MPPKCDKCGTVKGKDGTCKVCDGSAAANATECPACTLLGTGLCQECFDKVKRDSIGESIQKLQEAKSRIRAAPTRSSSDPTSPHKRQSVNAEDPPPSLGLPKNDENSGMVGGGDGGGGGGGSGSVEDPVLLAILELTKKVDNISLTQNQMVVKSDLETMQNKMQENTKVQISTAVDPSER